MKKEEELLELSEQYKKGYNHADMIINKFPKELENMEAVPGEPTEYTKGFQDRVRQYEIEKDALKGFSVQQLKEKYKEDLDKYNRDQSKDISKE